MEVISSILLIIIFKEICLIIEKYKKTPNNKTEKYNVYNCHLEPKAIRCITINKKTKAHKPMKILASICFGMMTLINKNIKRIKISVSKNIIKFAPIYH